MDRNRIWSVIETEKWVFVILEKERGFDSYRCIKTSFKDLEHINFEEVLWEDIKWWIN